MAEHERADEQAADEKAAVEQDRQTLKQAKRKVARRKHEDPGARQIAERLDDMTGAADLDNPVSRSCGVSEPFSRARILRLFHPPLYGEGNRI